MSSFESRCRPRIRGAGAQRCPLPGVRPAKGHKAAGCGAGEPGTSARGTLRGAAARRPAPQNPRNPPGSLPESRAPRDHPGCSLTCTFPGPARGRESPVRGAAQPVVLFKKLPGDSDAGAPRKPPENSGGHRAAPALSRAPGWGQECPGARPGLGTATTL